MAKQCFGNAAVPLSPAVRAGDFIYVSGQVPVADGAVVAGGIAEQTRQVLKNIESVLAMAGAAMSDVVKTTVILTDAKEFAEFNKTYAEFFPSEPPARTTSEQKLMIDIKVEIDAIAYKPL